MTIENGRPFTPGLLAECWHASAGRVRQLASGIMFILRLTAILAVTIVPARASEFSTTGAEVNTRTLFHRVAVFSDAPNSIHDPRHPQSQTGPDKMFAPIGLIWTNHRQPDQGTAPRSDFHMGTAFLVSPCYIFTAYHVVFGYRLGFLKGKEEPEQNVSATFSVGDNRSRAVPVKYGQFSIFPGRDWVLLRLEPDAGHRCLGEEPNIGWVRLAPLAPTIATKKSLSVAGYPSDKSLASLWRQDKCHFFEMQRDIDYDGMWTTDCATRPRSSGAPIFFVADGVLNVVAVMSGHLGNVPDNGILPKWDPNRANLALDIDKIISSDRDVLRLIEADIDRFHQPNPARVLIGRGHRNYNQVRPHTSLEHRPPAPVTETSGRSASKPPLPLLASAPT
jgi:V8-like Glu-specific endopeptidase